ncbi:MAG TPA: DHA2 family efflux MFS transporter permease subunit [Rhodopila sp.]|uniref:DHA2 family efflux MFS transporter permease subunit n=1 Tax=Rhodopila sp. TaxID=2480087 RepID=UPI002B8A2C2D|nr:DHA2 family efflux MFS transporter permease subunit [Rhodopila sp.]HVY17165.1 DHA2 family efflux MFS transporter permease subunit [Rhodopila sp.]
MPLSDRPSTPAPNPSPDAGQEFAVVRNPKLRLLIPLIVAFAFLMEQLDSTIVTTAIPDMALSLHQPPLLMNLTITAYILSLAVFIPVSGWISDRYGARRVFAAALLIFTVASAFCGMATSLPELIATRVVQGFGGAMMTPVGRLILLRAFPRTELVTAMTYMSLPAIVGPTLGPILGGVLTTYANWRWIFYVNVPIGLIGISLALRYVEDIKVPASPSFDVIGFVLCGAGLALLQFTLENVGHPLVARIVTILVGVAAGGLLAGYWVYAQGRQERRQEPALDLSLMAVRTFRVSTLAGGISRTGVNAVPFMLPLLFQIGFGLSPVRSGALTFIVSLGSLAIRPISAWLLRTCGFRALLIGNGMVCAVVIAAFALTTADTPQWLVFLHVMLLGIVRSIQFITTNTLTYVDVTPAKLSRATSLGGVIQQLTVSFGVSIAAALLGLIAGPGQLPSVADFHLAFLLIALLTLSATPGFLWLGAADGQHVSHHRVRAPVV